MPGRKCRKKKMVINGKYKTIHSLTIKYLQEKKFNSYSNWSHPATANHFQAGSKKKKFVLIVLF